MCGVLDPPRGYFVFYSHSTVNSSCAFLEGRCRFLCGLLAQGHELSLDSLSVVTVPSSIHGIERQERNCTMGEQKRGSVSALSTTPLRITLVASPRLREPPGLRVKCMRLIPLAGILYSAPALRMSKRQASMLQARTAPHQPCSSVDVRRLEKQLHRDRGRG
ncbi:hypothetical protein BC827DRAFT_2192 [Russula dissimulans]|nr:hypothetical protein BC827DRAFT_2192 [Russula dissimulans]